MITRAQQTEAQRHAAEMIRSAGITITDIEAESIEVVDFGLNSTAFQPSPGTLWMDLRIKALRGQLKSSTRKRLEELQCV